MFFTIFDKYTSKSRKQEDYGHADRLDMENESAKQPPQKCGGCFALRGFNDIKLNEDKWTRTTDPLHVKQIL